MFLVLVLHCAALGMCFFIPPTIAKIILKNGLAMIYLFFLVFPGCRGSPAKVGGQKTRFRSPLNSTAVLNLNCLFFITSSSLSLCTFLKKYQKLGSRVRHSVLPLLKSRFATSFSRCAPRRSLLVAMLGAARTRCAQTSCHLFPSNARLLAVPPNAALPPLAGNYLLQ